MKRATLLFSLVISAIAICASAGSALASGSIVTQLSADKTAVEVVSLPEGTGLIKVAVMKNLAGEGVTYSTIPTSQKSYTPPAGDPVVDMQAATSGGVAIGSWAGRLQTVPATAPKVTSVSPSSGSTVGGTAVTIKGSGFLSGATVTIGSAATSVSVVSETELKATTAAVAAGGHEVVVKDSKGTSTGGPSYTYVAAPTNVSAPTITGTAQQSQTLTEHHGSWTNEPTSYTYQWQQCNSLGEGCLAISGATSQTYAPAAGDVGDKLKVQEKASNAGGTSAAATSSATAVVTSGSIVTQLSADKTAVEVVSLPEGTGLIKVAVMKNLAGEGVTYSTIPTSQKSYTPPAGDPVVDMQAATSGGAEIGSWAGRLQTVPAAELKVSSISPTSGPAAGGTAVTIKGSGFLSGATVTIGSAATSVSVVSETELKATTAATTAGSDEVVVKDSKGTSTSGPTYTYTATSSEIVGVDAGGWNWESAVNDIAGAVRYVRSGYQNYDDETHVGYLAKAGITLMPLFGEGGTLAEYDNSTFVNEIVTWFKAYGKGGTFWAGKTDYGATTAEIINEPGNPFFYSDCCSAEGHATYADITRKVHAALEANFTASIRPKELVSYDGGYNGSEYGKAIFADGAVADGVTVHPYGGTSNREKSALGNRERVTQAHEQTALPVYVTEVGWPTAVGKEPTGDSLQWSEAEQAENITNWVTWTRSLGYVAATVNFNYADYGTNDFYGIVQSSGSPHKLSYAALKTAAGL